MWTSEGYPRKFGRKFSYRWNSIFRNCGRMRLRAMRRSWYDDLITTYLNTSLMIIIIIFFPSHRVLRSGRFVGISLALSSILLWIMGLFFWRLSAGSAVEGYLGLLRHYKQRISDCRVLWFSWERAWLIYWSQLLEGLKLRQFFCHDFVRRLFWFYLQPFPNELNNLARWFWRLRQPLRRSPPQSHAHWVTFS